MSNGLKVQCWTEDDLKDAIENLKHLRLTPEEHTAYVMTLSNNAIAIQMENERKNEAVREAVKDTIKETTEMVKKEAIMKALKQKKLSDAEIADYNNVSIEYVLEVKNQMI